MAAEWVLCQMQAGADRAHLPRGRGPAEAADARFLRGRQGPLPRRRRHRSAPAQRIHWVLPRRAKPVAEHPARRRVQRPLRQACPRRAAARRRPAQLQLPHRQPPAGPGREGPCLPGRGRYHDQSVALPSLSPSSSSSSSSSPSSSLLLLTRRVQGIVMDHLRPTVPGSVLNSGAGGRESTFLPLLLLLLLLPC